MSYYNYSNNCSCNDCCTSPPTIIYQIPYCQPQCPTPCPSPCPTPCPPQSVLLISPTNTSATIPSGGTPIPPGTIITSGSTTVPGGTVTVLNIFRPIPTTSCGYITMNNGFYTIPVNGKFMITANVSFNSTTSIISDFRALYIYHVEASTGLVFLIAADTRVPISDSPTIINLTSIADLKCGDRIFIAATQLDSSAASVTTDANVGKIAITKF